MSDGNFERVGFRPKKQNPSEIGSVLRDLYPGATPCCHTHSLFLCLIFAQSYLHLVLATRMLQQRYKEGKDTKEAKTTRMRQCGRRW